MTEALGKRDKIALGIDDDLLDKPSTLFEQAAQQMRLPGPGIALHQQAGRQKFLQIDQSGTLRARLADIDMRTHGAGLTISAERDQALWQGMHRGKRIDTQDCAT